MLGLCARAISLTPAFKSNMSGPLQAPWVGVSDGSSVLFWLFTRSLFDDEFRLRKRHLATWGAAFALGMAQCLVVGLG